MDGAFEHVMAALAIVGAVWAVIVVPLVVLAVLSNRARCSESDAIIAEAEAGELRRLAVAHG